MRNKIIYIPVMTLTLITALSVVGLSAARVSADDEPPYRDASVTVETTCAFTSEERKEPYALSVASGNSVDTTDLSDEEKPPFEVSCNDLNGFVVEAVGFSPDADNKDGAVGNTAMYSPVGTIPTGTSGTESYWAFRVSSATATGTDVESDYSADDTWYTIPGGNGATIASFKAKGDGTTVTGLVRTDYKVYASAAQAAGSYTGKVKYTLVQNNPSGS